ncbi:methyltransferase domain-containing protein, partial [Candidatus Calescamantes bacterium]|nr:methyltransferase domain-containing protein [Candidatus Calescamantes bacterium]
MIVSSNPDLNTHIRWYESGFWKPRIDMVLKQVESWKGKKVLDMGCGIGTFAIETAKRGAEVIAVDSFDESIRISKEMVKKYGLINKVKVIRANILTLPLQANTFDVIIIADVIEHIVDSSKLLDEIKRVGKEGSIVICTTKNALSFYLFLGYLVHRNIGMIRRGLKSLYRIFNRGNKKIDNRNPYITYVGHVNEYDPFRLRMDFKRKRFKIIYHATYSWNWRSDWKNLNRIFRPFFSSFLFKKIQNKLLGLFLGHDQIIVAKVSMKNNKKKILFNVSGSGVLSSNKGGAIEKIVANQVNYLSEKFEVIVFGQLSPLNENVEVVSYNRRMYLNKKSILNDVLFLIHGFWKMRKIEADIIISTHERNFVLSLLYAKIKRKPLIAWELDHVFWTPPWTTIKRFYHRLCLKSNLIITMSSEQKRRMIKQSIDHNKIKVIYNPVDTNKYCPLGKKSNTNYILYVAKFTERKNQLLLLKAFNNIVKKYDNLKLIFVGPKSGAFTGTKDSVSEYYVQCLNYI